MRSLRITPAAKQQLKEIWQYSYETWGEAKADSYLKDIEKKLVLLSSSPNLGKARPDIKPGYHSIRANSHIVFYLIDEAYINVIGVLHEKMDVDSHLS